MALEIHEIGIRMHVRDGKVGADERGISETCEGSETGATSDEREDLVEECVHRVLRALRTLQER